MKLKEIIINLCHYDLRNTEGIKELIELGIEENEGYGNYPKKDCYCDNCFYGRSFLAEEILKLRGKPTNETI